MSFIKRRILSTPFLGSREIIESETVFSQSMMSDPTFKANFEDWFSFYDKNRDKMYVFEVENNWAEAVGNSLETLYVHMEKFVKDTLLKRTAEEIARMFPMPGVEHSKFMKFIEYAKWTVLNRHRKIGSRFDYGMNERGDIFVYELNADTPSMLFESMNVQNLMSEHLGLPEAQFNEIWNLSKEDPFVKKDSVTAVVAYNAEGEDFGSTEAIAQLAENAGGAVYFTTIADLQYDPEERRRSPFFLDCMPHLELDNIYVMLPWEEMLASKMDIIDNWQEWKTCVNFFEPAWAWFLSHKALWAHMTQGDVSYKNGASEDGQTVVRAYYGAAFSADNYSTNVGVVVKPMLGRKSSAIRIIQRETEVKSKDQTYANTPVIYQPYHPTMQVEGHRVMGTMWMYGPKAACLSFREFDGEILENENERVIMHTLIET